MPPLSSLRLPWSVSQIQPPQPRLFERLAEIHRLLHKKEAENCCSPETDGTKPHDPFPSCGIVDETGAEGCNEVRPEEIEGVHCHIEAAVVGEE